MDLSLVPRPNSQLFNKAAFQHATLKSWEWAWVHCLMYTYDLSSPYH